VTPAFSNALALLDTAREGATLKARCPAHDDNVRSLAIKEKDGKVLIKCHAGCDTRDVIAAMGIAMTDLFEEELPSGPIEDATYDYRAEDGTLLYQAVRYRPKDFRLRRPLPDGRWDWNLDGVDRVPYHLPELATASEVFVVEGEKDADRLASHGLVATSNAGGAGKWRPEWGPLFEGKKVTIIPDNDDAGRAHAAAVQSSLEGYAKRIRIIELPGVKPKGDVSDWLDDHTWPELLTLLRPQMAPTIHDFITTAAVQATEDLYPATIPAGGLVIFVGQPRSFKTMAALQLMFSVASGHPWLGLPPARTGSALYVAEEGARAKVADRLHTMWEEHDPLQHDLRILHREGVTLTGAGWERVRATLDEMDDPTVVVLDTLAALMDGDENSVADIRTALRPIQDLITDYGVTVILVHHVNKTGEGRMGNRMRGSSALWGACDGTLGFVRKEDTHGLATDEGEVRVETKDDDPRVIPFVYQFETMRLLANEWPPLSEGALLAEVRQRQETGPVPIEDLLAHFGVHRRMLVNTAEAAKQHGLVETAPGYYKYESGFGY
jgi:putative DNA primase/helicase